MHESPVKLCGAAADALFVLMNGQQRIETLLPVFACRKPAKYRVRERGLCDQISVSIDNCCDRKSDYRIS